MIYFSDEDADNFYPTRRLFNGGGAYAVLWTPSVLVILLLISSWYVNHILIFRLEPASSLARRKLIVQDSTKKKLTENFIFSRPLKKTLTIFYC